MKIYNRKFSTACNCRSGSSGNRQLFAYGSIWIFLMLFMPLMALSQINGSEYGYVYISGQITNETSGAPVANQTVFIQSDISYNPSFVYSDSVVTNESGFYFDTIQTTCDQGSLVIFTYDVNNLQYKEQSYFRFYWDPEAHIVVEDIEIFDPSTNNDFQASFYALKDTIAVGELLYNFYDNSIGENIRTWEWDFGDNTIVTAIQNPQHVYDEPGVYNVTLTVSNKISHDDYFDISTITKAVQVIDKGYYHLGGHAKIGGFPIDYGYAYLYKFNDKDELIPIDTARIDTLGYYYFYHLLEGEYITRVQLKSNSVFFGQYLPTYFGNCLSWEQARVISLYSNNFECDINFIKKTDAQNGSGLIQGNITYGTGGENPENVPAEGVSILLMDNFETCTHYFESDNDGNFEFEELPLGTYKVHAEIPGKHTIPAVVTLDANNTNFNDLLLIILSNQITFDIKETGSSYLESISDVFPNPSNNRAQINLDVLNPSRLRINIVNATGQLITSEIYQAQQGINRLNLNTDNLSEGMYSILILTEDNYLISRKLIITRK